MGKKYLVEEVDSETEALGIVVGSIIGIGALIFINWSFFKSLTKMDAEVIGILIGMGITLFISLCIFIIKIKEGLFYALESTFKWTFGICFFLMVFGSILAPMIGYYIIYKTIEFILWDFIKTLFFNSVILIISTPLVSIIITIIVGIVGFILSFPIYKIIYKNKSKRIKKTECWEELKVLIKEMDFKCNIIKFVLFQSGIEFEVEKNHETISFSFAERGYNNLNSIKQLTLIDMIKKEARVSVKIDVAPYGMLYTVYNKELMKKKKTEERNYYKSLRKRKRIERRKNKDLQSQKKKEYKKAVKSGKNW